MSDLPAPSVRISFDCKQEDGRIFRALMVVENEFDYKAFFFLKESFSEVAEKLRNAAAALEKANSE